jgi:hypothetical protein
MGLLDNSHAALAQPQRGICLGALPSMVDCQAGTSDHGLPVVTESRLSPCRFQSMALPCERLFGLLTALTDTVGRRPRNAKKGSP